MTTRQITLVFEVDDTEYPELIQMPIEDLTDDLVASSQLDFDAEEAYGVLIEQECLTHIIVRHLENGDEKQIVARRLVPTLTQTATP